MKNFIRGVGVGILVTTLVFAVAYMLKGNEISDDEVRRRAAGLGMVEAETQIIKPKDTTEQAADVTGQESGETQPGEQEISGEPWLPLETETVTAEPADTVHGAENAVMAMSGDAVQIRIEKGQDGITISQTLQAGGVITDATDFNRYLSDNRLQNSILWGDFVLRKQMSYEEIVAVIVRR